jgi:hypothetical protein
MIADFFAIPEAGQVSDENKDNVQAAEITGGSI